MTGSRSTPVVRPLDRGLLILLSLAGGDKHGYAVMKDIEQFAGERLQPASLYPTLDRLEHEGLIVRLDAVGRTTPFRITARGRELVHGHMRIFADLAQLAEARGV